MVDRTKKSESPDGSMQYCSQEYTVLGSPQIVSLFWTKAKMYF